MCTGKVAWRHCVLCAVRVSRKTLSTYDVLARLCSAPVSTHACQPSADSQSLLRMVTLQPFTQNFTYCVCCPCLPHRAISACSCRYRGRLICWVLFLVHWLVLIIFLISDSDFNASCENVWETHLGLFTSDIENFQHQSLLISHPHAGSDLFRQRTLSSESKSMHYYQSNASCL